MMSRWWIGVLVASVVGSTLVSGSELRAQDPDPEVLRRAAEGRLGRAVTHEQIIEELRRSGMSRSQVRARLQREGYDPRLADRYFDALERGAEPPREDPTDDFLEALRRIGLLEQPGDTLGLEPDTVFPDTLAPPIGEEDTIPPEERIFGRSLFRSATTQFEPVTMGPVDPDYRLGPGDELVLILTGDVELAYTLDVMREGYVVIPDVGQVFVNGLTLGALRDRLYTELGRVYSGVRRGPEATTHFQVSLGRLRMNQVFLLGEVEWPGSYQVSSVATVLNAVYRAGGPARTGSFRRIQVHRGSRRASEVDLYDYLLRGDSRADVRLEHGDRIFVPLAGPRVQLGGAVRRPATYELKPGEGLRTLIAHAGGLAPDAVVRRVQIDRILPAAERRPGVDRVLLDVDVNALAAAEGDPIPMHDGDIVRVFGVSEERRHRLVVTGEVRRPGIYEWVAGSTLWDLIQRAEGLDERAYAPRAHIFRLNEADGSRRLIATPLFTEGHDPAPRHVQLADRDSVVIYSQQELRNPDLVSIEGFVKYPAEYELAEGMTVQDLILAAGGFTEGADVLEAEVSRMPDDLQRTDTTAIIFRVPLQPPEPYPPTPGSGAGEDGRRGFVPGEGLLDPLAGTRRDLPFWVPHAGEMRLQHGDRVVIRSAPGFEATRAVQVTGEVIRPGHYVLGSRSERLADLIRRSGGLTSEGYADGFQLYRGGHLVATNLRQALSRPNEAANVVLQPGDSLHVPQYDPTVLVTGAVTFETRVLYEPGKNIDFYIRRAGGLDDNADFRRASVTHMDGRRETVNRGFLYTRRPRPGPGSTVYVPEKPESEPFDWGHFLTTTGRILSATATLLLVIDRL